MPTVTMTMEEYLELVSGNDRSGTRKGSDQAVPRKRKGKPDPKMAKALKKANQLGRTKNGKLRKGYTQSKIMKKAHQLRRKM